jgi:hypothetical protein
LQDAGAEDDRARLFPHEHFVATDVGLAFGAVQDQRVYAALAGFGELYAGRKHGPAEADDAGLADRLAQDRRLSLLPVVHGVQFRPVVETVRRDHDAGTVPARWVADRMVGDGLDRPGRRGVQPATSAPAGAGYRIALAHPLARGDQRLSVFAASPG